MSLSPRTRALINEALLIVWAAVHFGALGGIGIGTGPFRAVVVYEGVEQPINAADVRHYLNTHCIKDGKTADWRQWPTTEDVANETDALKNLFSAKHASYPAVTIETRGGHRWSGSFPTTPADQLTLFKKWGGE